MGMVYCLRRATDAQLSTLLRQPALIERFLYDAAREEAVVRTGLWDKLASSFGFKRSQLPMSVVREEGDEIDIDKSWHVLHYLLTGDAEATDSPLSLLQRPYPNIGNEDIGWGPAFAIDSASMAAFAEAVHSIELAEFRYRFDPARMSEDDIYLGNSFDAEDDEGFWYFEHWFGVLRDFAGQCARRRCGAVGSII